MAQTVARRASLRWGLDTDEVLAVLQLWLCEQYKYVKRYRAEEGGSQKLVASLFRYANKWARKELDAHTITSATQAKVEDTMYETRDIEVAVTLMFMDAEAHAQYPDDWWATVADVSGCFSSLSRMDKELIVWRYHFHYDYEDIGQRMEISADAARLRVRRIIEKLTKRASNSKADRDTPASSSDVLQK